MARTTLTKLRKRNTDRTKSADQKSHIASTTSVQDARELLSAKKKEEIRTELYFLNFIFGENNTSDKTIKTNKQKEINLKTTRSTQLETPTTTLATQNKSDRREKEVTEEICVSRVDPNICMQEEKTHNEKPPKMTSRLNASHYLITEGLFATMEKA